MHDRDSLHKFIFENLPIRGHLVHLDASWLALIEHRVYPQNIRSILGESVAASVLLAATLKFTGHLSLQLQGNGPMHLLLAQCTDSLGVRALARHRETDGQNLSALCGEGQVIVTLDNGDDAQRYQGVVPIEGEKLAQCLESYFANSEQLPTRLWLHANEQGASGMLLQRLPSDKQSADQAEIDDAWRRVQLIGDTLSADELRALTDQEILHRLFNEDDIRMFERAPVFFRCTCSQERVAGMLQSLGQIEVESVLNEQGVVEVHCDFCNRAYRFDPVDVGRLFAMSNPQGGGLLH